MDVDNFLNEMVEDLTKDKVSTTPPSKSKKVVEINEDVERIVDSKSSLNFIGSFNYVPDSREYPQGTQYRNVNEGVVYINHNNLWEEYVRDGKKGDTPRWSPSGGGLGERDVKKVTGQLGIFTSQAEANSFVANNPDIAKASCSATIAGVPSVYRGPGVGWVVQGSTFEDLSLRAPTQSDNASKGYSAGSIWRRDRELYICKESSPSDATWGTLRLGAILPGDVAPAKTACIGGTVRCVTGYSGFAIDISVVISATPTTASIGLLPSGELDGDAVAKMYGRADAGTFITVTKIYDQSGNSNHLVQDASVAMPVLDWSAQQGRWIITGNDQTSKATLLAPSVSVAGNNFSVLAIGEVSNFANITSPIACLGSVASAAYSSILSTRSGSVQDFASGGARGPALPLTFEATPCVVQFVRNATKRFWFCNERYAENMNAPPAATLTGARINAHTCGAVSVTAGMRGCVWGFFNSALTDSELSAIRRGAYSAYGITPQRRHKIFIVGDSRVECGATTAFRTVAIALAEAIGRGAPLIYSLGVASQPQADSLANQYATVTALKEDGHLCIAIPLQGINDFLVGNKSVETALSASLANSAFVRASGVEFIPITELSTSSTTNGASTKIPLLREAMVANKSAYSGLIDVTTNGYVMSPLNSAAYSDGIHQKEATCIAIAGIVANNLASKL